MRLSSRDQIAIEVGTFGPVVLILGKEFGYLTISDFAAGTVAISLLIATALIATNKWIKGAFLVFSGGPVVALLLRITAS